MSEDRHFSGGDNYESKSLEELRTLLNYDQAALAAQLADEIGKRGAAAKRLADGMNELATKLAGRWQSTSVDKAKAAGDLLRGYGDEQELIAQQIGTPFASMVHVLKQVSEQAKELTMSGPEIPKKLPSGLTPDQIVVLNEHIARREQAKEALRQEAIELGRAVDSEAHRTDQVAPRFNDVPAVFNADPPPTPRPPGGGGGGGGGGWTPPGTLPGERGSTPPPVEQPHPRPTPLPTPNENPGWRPGEIEQVRWERPGNGPVDGGMSGGGGLGGLDSGRGATGSGGSLGAFGGGVLGGGPGADTGRGSSPGRAPAVPGRGPSAPPGGGVPGTAGRSGSGGGFMQPAVQGTGQRAEDEEHQRRYPYVEDLIGELPKVAPPVIGE
ncbi:hypothetical protein [Allokutzneria oryzae]|uniref:PPE domain-containing protein n=1 Tax=Allokutzneria oryzae TaxID=1378989 RepID=A0ABV6A9E9_9PSEU